MLIAAILIQCMIDVRMCVKVVYSLCVLYSCVLCSVLFSQCSAIKSQFLITALVVKTCTRLPLQIVIVKLHYICNNLKHHHRHQAPWAECPLMSTASCVILSCLSRSC